MEHNYKKKTKHLINIRTNNFIQSEIQKQVFFNELINELEDNFQAQHYQFLMSYLLSSGGSNHINAKRQKQNKLNTLRRINTMPNQRQNNLSQIDVNIFQETSMRKNHFSNQQDFRFSQGNFITKTKQNDQKCIITPNKHLNRKSITFRNKKILDLDRKLDKKYQANKRKLIYEPQAIFGIYNNNFNSIAIKAKYRTSLIKHGKDKLYRMRTQNDDDLPDRKQNLENEKFRFDLRKSNFLQKQNKPLNFKTLKDNLKKQQFRCNTAATHLPKSYIMEALLSKRQQIHKKRSNNQFSDMKLSPRYRNCFN